MGKGMGKGMAAYYHIIILIVVVNSGVVCVCLWAVSVSVFTRSKRLGTNQQLAVDYCRSRDIYISIRCWVDVGVWVWMDESSVGA